MVYFITDAVLFRFLAFLTSSKSLQNSTEQAQFENQGGKVRILRTSFELTRKVDEANLIFFIY